MFGPSDARLLRVTSNAKRARRVLRSRLVRMTDGIPGAYVGNDLTPGVRGWVVGSRMRLAAVPPGRNLWSNRRSPVIYGQIERRPDGGSDLRFAVYRQGFAGIWDDATAESFFDDWLRDLQSALDD